MFTFTSVYLPWDPVKYFSWHITTVQRPSHLRWAASHPTFFFFYQNQQWRCSGSSPQLSLIYIYIYLSVRAQYSNLCPTNSCSRCHGNYKTLEQTYTWPPSSLSLLYFLCGGSPCPMLRTFSFWWLWMISACLLHNLLRNCKQTELESYTHISNRCVLWKIANCEENLVSHSAISTDGFLPQISRRDRHKSLYNWWELCGGST
jgi:hypothetical protein